MDFLGAIETAELDHISSLFLAYRNIRAVEEQSTAELAQSMVTQNDAAQDQACVGACKSVLERIQATPDSLMVQRLARANVARRRQSKYWRCHREKLALDTHHSVSGHTPMSPPLGEHLTTKIPTGTLSPNSPLFGQFILERHLNKYLPSPHPVITPDARSASVS